MVMYLPEFTRSFCACASLLGARPKIGRRDLF